MDSDALVFERRTCLASRETMFVQNVLNAVNAESPSASIWEKDVVVASLRLSKPGF
jgi:hypothetical protein